MTNYLFVCGQNRVRSPAAAEYFSRLLKKKCIESHVESAGLSDHSKRQISKEICDIADVIFVMEEWMSNKLIKKGYADKTQIINLDILDIYFMGQIHEDWALPLRATIQLDRSYNIFVIAVTYSLGLLLKRFGGVI